VPDAVVIGAGPNGLVAANLLADAGWAVVVLEAGPEPGGAVRTAEVTAPGFRNDLYSAFYPFAAVSPAIAALRLEQHGLRWVHAPAVFAHARPGAPAAVLSRDPAATAESLAVDAAADREAWTALVREFDAVGPRFLDTLLGTFPPVRAGLRLAAALGPAGAVELARTAILPVRRLGEERFAGDAARLLLTGAALHADISPEGAGSGLLGWLMCGIAQRHGFPVPEGGAGNLTAALVARLEAKGGQVVCDARVERVVVRKGRAVAVRTADGLVVDAPRGVLADVDVVALYRRLVGEEHLPVRVADHLRRFHRGPATIKVDWALSGAIPWRDPAVAPAGTVHIGDSLAELSVSAAQVAAGVVPAHPLTLVGQMTTTDPTRSPAGTESAWAYAHAPLLPSDDAGDDGIKGPWTEAAIDSFARRLEDRIEAHAPGFRSLVVGRFVVGPPGLETANANLVGGDLSGGTAQLHQQLVLRPVPGLARPETPVRGLFLASASAHPGGGVHGACGANAARAALAHDRARRLLRR
jgi:phytoene dehydrogenase-like protein